jgi:hypothetical protein
MFVLREQRVEIILDISEVFNLKLLLHVEPRPRLNSNFRDNARGAHSANHGFE